MDRLATIALVLLFLALPLGATPLEIASGLGAAAALAVVIRDRRFEAGPLGAPAALLALGWLLLALGPGGSVLASLDRTWALSTVWVVPLLAARADREGALRIGLAAAAVLGAATVAQRLLGLPPVGLFSHHLTLAYALLPPLAAALGTGRPALALPIGLGILATGSSGAALAVGTVLLALLLARRLPTWGPGLATTAGVAVGLLALPLHGEALRERAVLWTGGARVALDGGTPPGTWRETIAGVHREIDPGFDFPHHAHDTLVQVAAEAGPGAWIAAALLAVALARHAPVWVLAAAGGLVIGGLTQDLVGDMEVLRAAAAWGSLGIAGTARAARVSSPQEVP